MQLRTFAAFLVLTGSSISLPQAKAKGTEFIEIEIRKVPSPRPAWFPGSVHHGGLAEFQGTSGSYQYRDLTRKSLRPSPGTRFASRFLFTDLLALAFGANRYQIVGPAWIYQTSYVIYFETREKVPDIRPVLRQILAEQFGLDAALSPGSIPTLVLEMQHALPALDASKAVDCWQGRGGVDSETLTSGDGPMALFRGCTMKDLASALEGRLHRRVIDATNCQTRYDFTLDLGDNLTETVYVPASKLWNKEMVQVAAKSIRQALGAELREEPLQTDTLVVRNVKRPGGKVRIRNKP
jgi:uncharacterized protein (TIGR03435 family)